ncbi:MAG: FHA domain-containing protein [Pseudanabaenaceae cyanobacterium]
MHSLPKNTPELRHLLTVSDDRGTHTFVLESSMYSIGRDPSNAIVVQGQGVSRQQAILLRMPTANKQYSYVLQDGNLEGKPSTHGTLINGLPVRKQVLKDGDEITIGNKVLLIYRILALTDQELENQATQPEFRRLKGNVLTAEKTAYVRMSDDETLASEPATPPEVLLKPPELPSPPPKLSSSLSLLKHEIQLFRECYQAVSNELRDLQLTRTECINIALAIYQKLGKH